MCITCDVKVKGLHWLKVALCCVKELIIKCLPLICCSLVAEGSGLVIEFPRAFPDNYESLLPNLTHFSMLFFLFPACTVKPWMKRLFPFFYSVHIGELLVSNREYTTSPSQCLPLTGLVSVLLSGSLVANLKETLRCCERLKVGQLPLPPVDLPCSEGPGTDWWQDSSSADRITNVWGCRRSTPSDESLPCIHGILISQE